MNAKIVVANSESRVASLVAEFQILVSGLRTKIPALAHEHSVHVTNIYNIREHAFADRFTLTLSVV
jgi:hypothetical protein